jgi:hypothetical protein
MLVSSLVSCAGDESRHVYRSSPPARASAPPAVTAAPELPVGMSGPSARVTAVLLASTGNPAPLDQVGEDLDVVTLVSRGRASSAQGPASIELHVAGSRDTTLVEQIGTPVPVIVAHVFRLPVGRRAGHLPDGRFELQVRLVGPTGRQLAASIPVNLGVRANHADDAGGP